MIDNSTPENGKQKGLDAALLLKLRQTLQETDECFLDRILRVGRFWQSAAREHQQAALVAVDELHPGLRIALSNLLQQVFVSLRDSAHQCFLNVPPLLLR